MNYFGIKKTVEMFSFLLHLPFSLAGQYNLEILISIINKAQEIGVIYDVNTIFHPEMKYVLLILFSFLGQFIKYSLIIDLQSLNFHEVIVIILFIVNFLILSFFLSKIFYEHQSFEKQIFLHYFLLYYPSIIYLPSAYLNFKYIQQGVEPLIILLALINLLVGFLVKGMHIYLARSHDLMENNNILLLHYSLLRNIISEIILLTAIISKIFGLHLLLRFALIFSRLIINVVIQIKENSCVYFVLIEIIAIISSTALSFMFSIGEYLIIMTLVTGCSLELVDSINNYHITSYTQTNVSILQKIEQALNSIGQQKSQIFLLIMFRSHKCLDCKHYSQLTQCIFRRILRQNSKREEKDKLTILYCNFISTTKPLPAVIKLLVLTPSSFYYQCYVKNLLSSLSKKVQQQQKQFEIDHNLEQLEDNSSKLDTQTIFLIWNCASEIFPIMIQTISIKITFLSQLTKGFNNINECIESALQTTNQMIQCRSKIRSKFNLESYQLFEYQAYEIVSLRILQIYFSAIYTNFYHSYQIGTEIETLLKCQIFQQDQPFSSLKLAQEKIFIFSTSLNRKRGELLKLNYRKLSKFLGVDEREAQSIQNCNDIMPEFIAIIHDDLIENYVHSGYTKLTISKNTTFLQNLEGYIEPCFINLYNYWNNNEDFILNLIMSKDQKTSEVIIFGVDGRILGMTKQFYEETIKSNIFFFRSINSNKSENQSIPMAIRTFLSKAPLIQFYILNIESQIEQLCKMINTIQNYEIVDAKSIWIIPNNHDSCLTSSEHLLKQFKNQYHTNLSNEQQILNPSKQSNHEQEKQLFCQEKSKSVEIDGIHMYMIHPRLKDQIRQTLDFGDVERSQSTFEISYTIQFKVLQNSHLKFGYFVLTLNEYKSRFAQTSSPQNLQQLFSINQGKGSENYQSDSQQHYLDKQHQHQISLQVEEKQEITKIVNSTMVNGKETQFLSSANQSFDMLNTKQLLETNRDATQQHQTTLINHSKLQSSYNLINTEKVLSRNFSQKQLEFEKIEEISRKEENNNNNSQPSSYQNKKPNLLIKLQERKVNQNYKPRSNQSRTSIASTQKESQLVVEQIYYNEHLITPLKKITTVLINLLGVILLFLTLNIILIQNQLDYQTTVVMGLIEPQNIIYYYSAVFYQMWALELDSQQILTLSEFQREHNIKTLDEMLVTGEDYVQQSNLAVAITAENLGIATFNMRVVQHQQIILLNYELQSFYLILQEITDKLYKINYGLSNPYYDQLHTLGFCRQNILQLMDLHNKLVVELMAQTIDEAGGFATTFLSSVFAGIFSVLLLLTFQMQYWFFIDKIKKFIILLITRLNENEVNCQISKLTAVNEILIKYEINNWQMLDIYEIMHQSNLIRNNNTSQTNPQKAKTQSKVQLHSRIRNKHLFTKMNLVITIIIMVALFSFVIFGFLLYTQMDNDFFPSLIATLKFSEYRIKMDSIGYIGGIVKTENLVEGNNMAFINETYALSLLLEYKNDLSPLLNEISSTILTNALNTNGVSRFDSILNEDICSSVAMASCNPSIYNLPYSSKDYMGNLVKNGILGYTASLIKYLDSDYDYEFQYLKYNSPQENRMAIQSQSFENYFLTYYCDLQDTMLSFLNLFKVDNAEIANSIIFSIRTYYLGLGLALFFSVIITGTIWIRRTQQQMSSLRQILILLPPDAIFNETINSQARLILSWLY